MLIMHALILALILSTVTFTTYLERVKKLDGLTWTSKEEVSSRRVAKKNMTKMK